jgi:hypothetical protein
MIMHMKDARARQYPMTGRYRNLSATSILRGMIFNTGPRVRKNHTIPNGSTRAFRLRNKYTLENNSNINTIDRITPVFRKVLTTGKVR